MLKILKVSVVLVAFAAFAGCSSKKSDGDVIRIGGIFPLSGTVAVYGVECRNGVELAIEQLNAEGGINGKKLVLIPEDDEGSPEKAVNAYKKLVSKDKVKLVIGSLTSGCAKAVSSLAQSQKVLQIAPAATEPSITDAGNFVFRMCFIDPFQGVIGAKFAYESLNCRNAAILYDVANDYSVGLTTNFREQFTKMGGNIVSQESYSTGDKDFNAQLTKIKNSNPDVVYLPDYYNTVSLIAKQLRVQGITTPLVGADGWGGIVETAGDEVNGGYFSDHFSADADDSVVKNFVNSFKAKFGTTPVSFAALGYDSVFVLKDAILRAGSADDPAAIAKAMMETNGHYVTGSLTFDEKRNPIKSAVMVELQSTGGKVVQKYHSTINP